MIGQPSQAKVALIGDWAGTGQHKFKLSSKSDMIMGRVDPRIGLSPKILELVWVGWVGLSLSNTQNLSAYWGDCASDSFY